MICTMFDRPHCAYYQGNIDNGGPIDQALAELRRYAEAMNISLLEAQLCVSIQREKVLAGICTL